jgi:hypothetical protein
MIPIGGTATAGQRNNIVTSEIRGYGIAKRINRKKPSGDKVWTSILEWL